VLVLVWIILVIKSESLDFQVCYAWNALIFVPLASSPELLSWLPIV
jgi:hypothetical protein